MTPIEWMALLFVAFAIVKILVIIWEPKKWLVFVEFVYAKPVVTTIVGLVLAVITLWYLLQDLTIVDVFGVLLFFMFIMLMSFATMKKEMLPMARKALKDKNILKRAWLPTLVWVVLLLWALKELFL